MAQEIEREYVRNWRQTGQVLEAMRWQEVRSLSDADASKAALWLIAAACLVPLPPHRRSWSGLVDLQDRLHGRR